MKNTSTEENGTTVVKNTLDSFDGMEYNQVLNLLATIVVLAINNFLIKPSKKEALKIFLKWVEGTQNKLILYYDFKEEQYKKEEHDQSNKK